MVCLLLPRVNSPHDLPNGECDNLLLSQGSSEVEVVLQHLPLRLFGVRQPKLSIP